MSSDKLGIGVSVPVRYAVRQVLDQEYRKGTIRKQSEASQLKYKGPNNSKSTTKGGHSGSVGGVDDGDDKENIGKHGRRVRDSSGGAVKRDFFGRIINEAPSKPATSSDDTPLDNKTHKHKMNGQLTERRVWLTFHEGYSNAVRKPISMSEFLADL
jgi:chromosome transmission fidelity protein 18